MSSPDVSVVVCSYNRADSLRSALESLTALQTDGFTYEVVVVDNASSDHTADVIHQAAESSSCPVRYVMEKEPGVSFARNTGVRSAKGQWIYFFDDDQLAEPQLLVEMLKGAKENNVKCTGGGMKLKFVCDDLVTLAEPRNLKPWVRVMFNCTQTTDVYSRKDTPGTGNMMVHREIFDKIGLFRTDLVEGGEDTDLYHRMRAVGYEACHVPNAVVHHCIPEFRLEPKYLKLASLRMGSHVARREYQEFSRLVFPFRIVARAGQAYGVHGSRLAFAYLGGDKEAILERQCKWWLGQGYLAAALKFLVYNEEAKSNLEFRNERKTAET